MQQVTLGIGDAFGLVEEETTTAFLPELFEGVANRELGIAAVAFFGEVWGI